MMKKLKKKKLYSKKKNRKLNLHQNKSLQLPHFQLVAVEQEWDFQGYNLPFHSNARIIRSIFLLFLVVNLLKKVLLPIEMEWKLNLLFTHFACNVLLLLLLTIHP